MFFGVVADETLVGDLMATVSVWESVLRRDEWESFCRLIQL